MAITWLIFNILTKFKNMVVFNAKYYLSIIYYKILHKNHQNMIVDYKMSLEELKNPESGKDPTILSVSNKRLLLHH